MSRNSRFQNLELNPHYGVFTAKITKIVKNAVHLKDIFTEYEFVIHFPLSSELAFTRAGKEIWLNQFGDVGIGLPSEHFESFSKVRNSTIPCNVWRARKGEAHLFAFLKAYKRPNPFNANDTLKPANGRPVDYTTDYMEFRRLFLIDSEIEPSVGGIIYVTPEFKEIVLPHYIPSHLTSAVRNLKGDFSLSKDPKLVHLKNLFTKGYQPQGYYNWSHIKEFELTEKL